MTKKRYSTGGSCQVQYSFVVDGGDNFQKVMGVSEESYLLALVSALNLTHLVAANSTSSDLAVILEEVPAE